MLICICITIVYTVSSTYFDYIYLFASDIRGIYCPVDDSNIAPWGRTENWRTEVCRFSAPCATLTVVVLCRPGAPVFDRSCDAETGFTAFLGGRVAGWYSFHHFIDFQLHFLCSLGEVLWSENQKSHPDHPVIPFWSVAFCWWSNDYRWPESFWGLRGSDIWGDYELGRMNMFYWMRR